MVAVVAVVGLAWGAGPVAGRCGFISLLSRPLMSLATPLNR